MSLIIRKSIKIGKNTRINLSKSGVGISTGIKGARVSIGPRGIRKSVKIPGTGIYATEQTPWKKLKENNYRNSNAKIETVLPYGVNISNYPMPKAMIYCMIAYFPLLIVSMFFWPLIFAATGVMFFIIYEVLFNKDYKSGRCTRKAENAYKIKNYQKCAKYCDRALKYRNNNKAALSLKQYLIANNFID